MIILCIDTHTLQCIHISNKLFPGNQKNSYCNVLNKIKAIELLYIYHFSVGVQRRRLGFNLHIARAISWESGLPMTLILRQFKETMRFDSLF